MVVTNYNLTICIISYKGNKASMALGKHLKQGRPFVYALQCLTEKVDNNTDRIPTLAGLSRLNHQAWCLAGIRVAGGFKSGLEQVFFH